MSNCFSEVVVSNYTPTFSSWEHPLFCIFAKLLTIKCLIFASLVDMKWYCLVLFGISTINNTVEHLSRCLLRAISGPFKSLIESARAPEEHRWLTHTEQCEEILIKGDLQMGGQDPKAAGIALTSYTLGLQVRRECDLLWRVQQDSGGPMWSQVRTVEDKLFPLPLHPVLPLKPTDSRREQGAHGLWSLPPRARWRGVDTRPGRTNWTVSSPCAVSLPNWWLVFMICRWFTCTDVSLASAWPISG